MVTMVPTNLSLDDFDALMDAAEGKGPRKSATLTSYGPVNPALDPHNHISLTIPPMLPPRSYAPNPIVVAPRPMPVSQPLYYTAPDPMPRASAMVHAILFFTTAGVGNVIYQLHIIDKRAAWRARHQL